MKVTQKKSSQTAGELIQQLGVQTTIAKRFKISMPIEIIENQLAALYGEECRMRGKEPSFDEHTRQHIAKAARWLANSNDKFGLILLGLYGNGKTTLLKAICRLINRYFYDEYRSKRKSITIVNANEIARIGSNEDKHSEFEALCKAEFLAIDDLGEEPREILRYGQPYQPLRDLLLKRYELQGVTIATTNLCNSKKNPQLQQRYGERVADRLNEMRYIVFGNESYRGND